MIERLKRYSTGNFLHDLWRLFEPYLARSTGKRALLLYVFALVSKVLLIYVTVLSTDSRKLVFDAISKSDYAEYLSNAHYFSALACFFIVVYTLSSFFKMRFELVSSKWLTEHLTAKWLQGNNSYKLKVFSCESDNPDERISHDIYKTIYSTVTLSITFLESLITVLTFGFLLYEISPTCDIHFLRVSSVRYVFWLSIMYTVLVSVLTLYIGRSLQVNLFLQEKLLGNFRFALMRIREYADSIASYYAEKFETANAHLRINKYIAVLWKGNIYKLQCDSLAFAYNKIVWFSSILFLPPLVFTKEITLGVMMQISMVFTEFCKGMLFLANSYVSIANYKVAVMRLIEFSDLLDNIKDIDSVARTSGKRIEFNNLSIVFPSSGKIIKSSSPMVFKQKYYKIRGPSGSGKTTFLRAILGIWPSCEGDLKVSAQTMLLPQRSYIPYTDLLRVITYPDFALHFPEEDLKNLLDDIGLQHLKDLLHVNREWEYFLSGGERQKIAILRAIMQKPRYLLLDEALNALDSKSYEIVKEMLQRYLPDTIIIEVTHDIRVLRENPEYILIENDVISPVYT